MEGRLQHPPVPRSFRTFSTAWPVLEDLLVTHASQDLGLALAQLCQEGSDGGKKRKGRKSHLVQIPGSFVVVINRCWKSPASRYKEVWSSGGAAQARRQMTDQILRRQLVQHNEAQLVVARTIVTLDSSMAVTLQDGIDPTPDLITMWTYGATHTPRRQQNVYYLHEEAFLGAARQPAENGLKKQAKKTGLGFDGGQRVSQAGSWRGHPGLLIHLSRCGAKGRGRGEVLKPQH